MSSEQTAASVGRRPGANQTRQAIVDAARARFEAQGYAGASLRAIARDAGVDPALVGHFFGSKAGLFGAVVQWPLDPARSITHMLDGDLGEVGTRLAETFVQHWSTQGWRSPIIALVSAATADAAAASLLRDFLTTELLIPMLEAIGADQPRLRAGLISSLLIGLGLGRHVLGLVEPSRIEDQRLIDAVGPTLQHFCTQPLP